MIITEIHKINNLKSSANDFALNDPEHVQYF